MSDKEKAQTGIPRPARGLPRPTGGLPRPTAQTGARGPAVKIAFGRRIQTRKTKPRQAMTMTVTRDKTVKRLRNSSSSSKEESPAAVQGAKRANIDEEKLMGTIVKKSYALRPRAKNPVNGICTTSFNPKATLNFTEFNGFTGKKSLPKTGLDKENAVLKEQVKTTKEELKVAKEELEAAKKELEATKQASHEQADEEKPEGENQQLKKDLEMCEKKLISLDVDPVSLATWSELKEARENQRKETTTRAHAMQEKWKGYHEQTSETNKELLELKEKLEKLSQTVGKSEDKLA
ncbi:microtubule-associated protein 1B-like isoform X4 [Branchiostoma lanceolatum]|uniref:microtubule-associated protein 1B-like isoform X4 n=1 Tax=Branchiostoma lanceolatum TaxID=7740 RepID=UPI003455CAF4